MIARKLPYYVRSLGAIAAAARNPWVLAPIALGRGAELCLRGELRLRLAGLLDVLLVVENVLDDVYGLGLLDDPRCIVDVGAGFGEFSVAAARRFPRAHVLAFEPDPVAFERLRANVARNDLANVEVERLAIGTAERYALRPHPHGARSCAVDATAGTAADAAGRRLADVLPAHVDLLKVDCEGAELDVLQSLEAASLPRVARIVLEYHDHIQSDSRERLTDHLSQHGFRCRARPDRYDARIGLVEAARDPQGS